MSRGHDRERLVGDLLEVGLSPINVDERAPFWVIRAAGSLGEADVIAARGELVFSKHEPIGSYGGELLMVEVKSDDIRYGPYNNLGPKRRQQLRAAAKLAGADLWLAYVPPSPPGVRGVWGAWIHHSEWPR